ncbi:MAG: DUF3836 domain-containing protein [Bacteroides sp.]|nr:DUF3836 domain-containing protein [Bacteroides sp.]
MKTVLAKSVVLIAMMIAGISGFNLYAGSKYIAQDEGKDNKVVIQTLYRNIGGIKYHLKYCYSYDDENRLTSKETFKWDKATEAWAPYYLISYTYSNGKMVMDFAKWNPKDFEYNLLKQRNVYRLDEINQPTAYLSYKWDERKKGWKMIKSVDFEYGVQYLVSEY